MKCDELEAEQWLDYSGEPMPCYPKVKVDAAIAELKAAHHKERHEYIKMVAELKAEINRKDAVGKRWFERCMEARTENVKLKRALYKACANWAHVAVAFFSSYADKEKWRKMERKCRSKAEKCK